MVNGSESVGAAGMRVDFPYFIGVLPFSTDKAYPSPAEIIRRIFGYLIDKRLVIDLPILSVAWSTGNNPQHPLAAFPAGMRCIHTDIFKHFISDRMVKTHHPHRLLLLNKYRAQR